MMDYVLVLLVGESNIYKLRVSAGDSFTIGSGSDDRLFVQSLAASQLEARVGQDGSLSIRDPLIYSYGMPVVSPDGEGQILPGKRKMVISIEPRLADAAISYPVPKNGMITLGKSNENTISIRNKKVSRHHFVINCEDGVARIEDGYGGKASRNGIYLNGKRVTKSSIYSGDVIDILGIRIRRIGDVLRFENVGDTLEFSMPIRQTEAFQDPDSFSGYANGTLLFLASVCAGAKDYVKATEILDEFLERPMRDRLRFRALYAKSVIQEMMGHAKDSNDTLRIFRKESETAYGNDAFVDVVMIQIEANLLVGRKDTAFMILDHTKERLRELASDDPQMTQSVDECFEYFENVIDEMHLWQMTE